MNGANGMSDIEGKGAQGSAEEGGSQPSFNADETQIRNCPAFICEDLPAAP
ncbi:MAG: hypothetical protein QOH39_3077 [Verrucomicrobiota bacterium]|jgi:hypothetical protein